MTVAEIAGVTITEDAIGNPSQIIIDLNAHPEAIPVLKNLGLLPKTQFDIDFENGHSVEEFRQALHTAIKEEYANRS